MVMKETRLFWVTPKFVHESIRDYSCLIKLYGKVEGEVLCFIAIHLQHNIAHMAEKKGLYLPVKKIEQRLSK